MASAQQIERWRKRLAAGNATMIRALARAMRLELEVCADDWEAGRWNAGVHASRVEAIFVEHYRRTIVRVAPIAREMLEPAERAAEIQTREVEGALFADRTAALIRVHGPARARRVAARSQAIVTEAIADAAAEGMGEREAARLLRQRLASSRMALHRARTIARTEIGAAQNAGLLASADELGVSYHRAWITITDGRERLSHALADGQTIGPGQKFKVGDAELEHPGDPTGPAEEVINCRCTMLLEPT